MSDETIGGAFDRALRAAEALPWPLSWWHRRRLLKARARMAKWADRLANEIAGGAP